MVDIFHTQLRIASLREENDLASFCSNSDELNDFLKSDAVNYRVLKGAASHVIAKTCITDM
ncbi:MAG: hypothetical protein M0Q43_05620 [Methanothrix sp.]|jgi:hypothetical protein|nr:hypothetical protein [Methanothrix sp.]